MSEETKKMIRIFVVRDKLRAFVCADPFGPGETLVL